MGAGTELFRCFSSCPKPHCKARPFQKKTTFRVPKSCSRKVVFSPFQTLLGAGTELFRCFSSCPKRHCKGRQTLPIANSKEVFYFPFQTFLGAGTELFRCFSSCPKLHCKGRPFQLQIKKTTFRALKSWFFFPFQTLLGAGTELFRCFSSCPKPHCKGRPFQKKTTFRGPKSCFFYLSRHSWEQALSFSGAFSAAQSAIAKGDPSNCKLKNNLSSCSSGCAAPEAGGRNRFHSTG